jgi:hypothetical protein
MFVLRKLQPSMTGQNFLSVLASYPQVLISVPKNLGLVLDYNSGLSLPSEGRWPR